MNAKTTPLSLDVDPPLRPVDPSPRPPARPGATTKPAAKPASAATAHSPADGRVARSRRTNEHIVGALLELIEHGHLRPTAHQVARRAGVSRRGLYLHFESIEDLFATAAERRTREVQAEWQAPSSEAPLEERIDGFCLRWASVLEVLNPLRRAAAVHEPFSHRVATVAAHTRRWAHSTVERSFQPEVVSTPDDERTALVTALHQATSWSAWDELRRHGCDVNELSEAMRRLLTALLREPAGNDGAGAGAGGARSGTGGGGAGRGGQA